VNELITSGWLYARSALYSNNSSSLLVKIEQFSIVRSLIFMSLKTQSLIIWYRCAQYYIYEALWQPKSFSRGVSTTSLKCMLIMILALKRIFPYCEEQLNNMYKAILLTEYRFSSKEHCFWPFKLQDVLNYVRNNWNGGLLCNNLW